MALTKYNIDAAAAVRGQKGLTDAQKNYNSELDSSAKRLTKAERLARRLAEQADPMKEYARKTNDWAGAVKRGELNSEDAALAVARLQGRVFGVAKEGKKAFGSQALSQIASYAGGIISASAVIGGIKAIFTGISEEADAAAERVRSTLDAIGELQQLSDFSKNSELSKDLVKRGIAKDTSQAARIVFQLSSSGIRGEDRDFILNQVAANKLVAPENLATFSSKVEKSRNVLGLGSLEDAVNKILQTSDSTDSNATAIAQATTKFGSQMSALGFKGDAGLAALTTVLQSADNQDVAANQLRALLTQIDKRGLSKGGLRSTVVSLQKRVQAGESIQEILGETRAIAGFRNIRNRLGFFDEQLGLISSAGERDLVSLRGSEIRNNSSFNAAFLAEEAAGNLSISSEEVTAERRNLVRAAYDSTRARLYREGKEFEAGLLSPLETFDIYSGSQEYRLRAGLDEEIRNGFAGDGGNFSESLERAIASFLDRSEGTNANINRLIEAIEANGAGS